MWTPPSLRGSIRGRRRYDINVYAGELEVRPPAAPTTPGRLGGSARPASLCNHGRADESSDARGHMLKRQTSPAGPPDLAALAPGPFKLLHSRRPSERPGVVLERYLYSPGERSDVSLDWHLMVLLRSASNRGVCADPRGAWVPFANTRGAMAVLPAGCGPAVRLATSCDVTVYGFAPKVLNSFREELDGPRPPELNRIAATRDADLLALLHLLDRELGLGEPSGRLYADSLAFALLARAVALSSHHARTLPFDASPLSVRAQKRLFEFVEENLDRNLSLEDLAIQVG